MMKISTLAKWGMAVLLLSSLSSCEDVLEKYFPRPAPSVPTFPSLGLDIPFYALSGGSRLDAYSTKDAATRTSSVAITGLASGEKLLAIDFRPATGQLYGVSSASRLYVINQNTGAAHAIGTGAFTPALGGNLVGFDFNPTVDRIRLITSTGQNLRLNPETGTVASTDGAISGVAGASITAVAYTNNVAGATTTELYAINSASRQLYLISQPNEGTVAPIGGLNLNIIGDGGFDIHGKSGTALGLYAVSGTPTLFAVDLATGAAKSLAQYDVSLDYSSIAIPTSPVAYAVTINNDLLIVDPTNPSTSITKPITGLTPNEELAGLDFRPLNGQLYALTVQRPQGGPQMDNGRLYTINAATAEATRVASLSVPLTFRGAYGFDFNPVVDRIRIVSRSGLNIRVNPVDGSAIQDGDLNPGTPVVEAAAYDNNFAGATTTNLYVIDTRDFSPRAPFLSAKLFQLNAPNAGNMVEVGDLELNAGPGSNFDIGGTTNTGYAVLNITGSTELYTIDLATGKATCKGIFGRSSGGIGTSGFTVGLGF